MNSEILKNNIKRAYEWARFRQSLILLLWTIPLTLFSIWACGTITLSIILGTLLSVAAVLFLWRGQILGKAALTGLFLGTIAFLIPLVFHLSGLCCKADLEKEICAVTGALVGIILARSITKVENKKVVYTSASLGIIILAGVLGCGSMGAGAVVGLVGGILIPIIPFYSFFKKA